jgi:Fuc2NAc and GlcNAc transferase
LTSSLALPCAVAAATSLVLLVALKRWAPQFGLMDVPIARSSHRVPRPRGGGLAIVAGVLAGIATLAARGEGLPSRTWIVLGAALAIAALGLWDDVANLPASVRLATHVVVAVAVVGALGGLAHLPLPAPAGLELHPAGGAMLAILWLAGVTNFFNFMDGIDGLAAGQALVAILALAWIGAGWKSGHVTWLIAATLLVFIGFNWTPARIFLGDTGSGFLGFFLAASPWLGPVELREQTLLLVAVSLALFLCDPLWTLAVRWRRGAYLLEGHREHLYQRLAERVRGHAPVAIGVLAAAVPLAALAVWSFGDAPRTWLALGIGCVIFLIELSLARSLRG